MVPFESVLSDNDAQAIMSYVIKRAHDQLATENTP